LWFLGEAMHSKNEWGKLNKVVVGHATNARVPERDISLRHINMLMLKMNSIFHQGDTPK